MEEELQGSIDDKNELDQRFEASVEKYINKAVADARGEYRTSIQPFTVYEQEIRTKLGEVFHFFYTSFSKGYRTLIEELEHEMKISESKEDLLTMVAVDPEKLKIFEDTDALIKTLEEGHPIYELLGFTENSLNVFYHALSRMIENKEFEKARDVGYFLVTIAPGVSQFWVCIGECDVNLHEYEIAFQELSMAIEVDPTETAAYVEIVDLLLEMRDFDKATSLCDAGLEFASTHREKPWAETLSIRLKEKMYDVNTAFHNS